MLYQQKVFDIGDRRYVGTRIEIKDKIKPDLHFRFKSFVEQYNEKICLKSYNRARGKIKI